jgi:hypothetical protein
MTLTILSFTLGIIQTVIVGISAYFLLRQLRQFDKSLQHDSYSKAVEYYVKINEIVFEHPNLMKFFPFPNYKNEKLKDDEKQFYQYLVLIMGFYERLFQLYQMKWIDQKTWEAWERWLLEAVLPLDIFQFIWQQERTYFHEDFYKYVDQKFEEALPK